MKWCNIRNMSKVVDQCSTRVWTSVKVLFIVPVSVDLLVILQRVLTHCSNNCESIKYDKCHKGERETEKHLTEN